MTMSKNLKHWDLADLHKMKPEWQSHLEFSILPPRFFRDSNEIRPLFLVRTQRMRNQCMQDYFMMIAEKNYLPSMLAVCRVLNIDFNAAILLSDEKIEKMLNGELKPQPEIHFKNIHRHPDLLARICSFCLRQGLGVSDIKNYAYSITCEIHQVMLIDRCPKCENFLRYTRRRRNFCNCGYDLRDCPVSLAETWIQDFYRIFAPWRLNFSEPEFNVVLQKSDVVSWNILCISYGRRARRGRLTSKDYEFAKALLHNIELNEDRHYVNFFSAAWSENI